MDVNASAIGRAHACLGLAVPIVCAAAWPAAALAHRNVEEGFALRAVLTPLLVVVAAGLLAAIAAWRLARVPAPRAGAVAAIAVAVLFLYGPIVGAWTDAAGHAPPLGGPAAAWAVIAASIVGVAWRATRHAAVAQSIALTLAAGTTLAAGQLAAERARWTRPTLTAGDPLGPVAHPPATAPNVYLFVLDELARPDVLRAVVGASIDAEVAALARRGFVVATRASANYPMTYLSLATLFAMRYPAHGGAATMPGALRVAPLLQHRNATVRRFRALGYGYTHVQPGLFEYFSCHGLEQRCVGHADESAIADEARAYLLLTPAHAVLQRIAPRLVASELTTVADVARALAQPPARPMFTFVHLLLPHERVFRPDCRVTADDAPRRDRIAYVTSARCTLRGIATVVDSVVARDSGAIVLVASDHGSDFLVPWDRPPVDWPRAAVVERLSSFAAIRLPARCRGTMPDDVSPVNLMRLVFACVERTPPQLIADSAFLVSRTGAAVVAVERP